MSMQPFLVGLEGAELRRDLSAFFTPQWLAERVWRWAIAGSRFTGTWLPSVLEPSAGRGALLRASFADIGTLGAVRPGGVVAFDVDPVNVAALKQLGDDLTARIYLRYVVRAEDFLAADIRERFDIALMNPPYEDNQDVAFIERACTISDRAVVIAQSRIEFSEGRSDFWRWHDVLRKVVLEKRPQFGGDQSGKTDFVVLDVVRRSCARLQGEAMPMTQERW